MITHLTPEQEAKIPVYIKNAIEVGHDTSPIDKESARQAVKEIWELCGFGSEPEVVFYPSPKACQIASNEMRKENGFDDQCYLFWYWANYYNFYYYVRNELFPEKINEFKLLDKFISWNKALHYIQRVGNTCLVSDRPRVLIVNNNGLHNETSKALEYSDGFGVYSINGVRMAEESLFFFDPNLSDSQKAKKIMKVQNVEQRSELIRSFGMSKMLHMFKFKVIDTYKEYELLLLDIGTGRTEEYLKMTNPSTEEIHVECVGKGVKSVLQALESRVPQNLRDKYGYKEAIARS